MGGTDGNALFTAFFLPDFRFSPNPAGITEFFPEKLFFLTGFLLTFRAREIYYCHKVIVIT